MLQRSKYQNWWSSSHCSRRPRYSEPVLNAQNYDAVKLGIHWTGLLDDWTIRLDYCACTGLLDWSTGLDYWTGLLDWTTELDYWTGLLDWTTGLTFLPQKSCVLYLVLLPSAMSYTVSYIAHKHSLALHRHRFPSTVRVSKCGQNMDTPA